MSLNEILKQLQQGSIDIIQAEKAIDQLQSSGLKDLGFAQVDIDREQRTGFPEVIYAEGKTTDQIIAIFQELLLHADQVIATRVNPEKADAILNVLPNAVYQRHSRLLYQRKTEPEIIHEGYIAIVCAGTSDLPVAEEAAFMAESMGNQVLRIHDVGVAGLHRLLRRIPEIRQANVIVAVAGMEGAVVSVLGGLVDKPIIAIPTSVGYGSHQNGMVPLLAMLNSCAPGVSVVNIDNGFGGGYMAGLINRIRLAK